MVDADKAFPEAILLQVPQRCPRGARRWQLARFQAYLRAGFEVLSRHWKQAGTCHRNQKLKYGFSNSEKKS